jgi:hypothetical protein
MNTAEITLPHERGWPRSSPASLPPAHVVKTTTKIGWFLGRATRIEKDAISTSLHGRLILFRNSYSYLPDAHGTDDFIAVEIVYR